VPAFSKVVLLGLEFHPANAIDAAGSQNLSAKINLVGQDASFRDGSGQTNYQFAHGTGASANQDFSLRKGLLLINGPIPALFPGKTAVPGTVGFEALTWCGGTFNLETRHLTVSDNQRGWLFNGRITAKPRSLAPV
jgi:hypothetical protein